MCGILGFFSADRIEGLGHALQAANDVVSYRGPDDAGFALFSLSSSDSSKVISGRSMPTDIDLRKVDVVLAHRRLSIIDLSSSGHQPMGTADGKCWITYNGEIFNYLELRSELIELGSSFESNSDTEVVLHAYRRWGEDCVNRFNGMWAFAIIDLEQRRIFCSRDRFGVKPFHYYFDGTKFVFASEIKQLLCFPFIRRRVNHRTVYEFLVYEAVEHSSDTFFSDIHNLLPGHNLSVNLDRSSATASSFYNPHFLIDRRIEEGEAAERFSSLLSDSIRLRLRSDVPVGSCLSGGLDSSSIVCLMHSLLDEKGHREIQHTFSSHFEDKEANELEYMKEVVNATDATAHYVYPSSEEFFRDLDGLVWHQEEPFGSTSIFAQWSVFSSVHDNGIKVMLDGQGADEILGGYQPLGYRLLSEYIAKGQILRYLREGWFQNAIQGKPVSLMALQPIAFLLPRPLRSLADRLRRSLPKGIPHPTAWVNPRLTELCQEGNNFILNQHKKAFRAPEVLNNTLYQLTFFGNLQALLKYEDRNSMAFSVEARVPFLDYRLVEFVFSLPSHLKIKDGYTKLVLRKGMEGVLPPKVQWRVSKLGFATPERTWQKKMLQPLINEAITDDRMAAFISEKDARQFLTVLDKSDRVDFTPWRWISLSLWMKKFELSSSYGN
jgi:asparagine synthase (glutamine-hydrolysing)